MIRPLRLAGALALLSAAADAAVPTGSVEVRLEKLRNARGVVHLCLTRKADSFPECARDPDAVTRTVAANAGGTVSFDAVKPGAYALAVFHDENGNKKLDTFLGVPREGFGFSRNPAVHFGPPSFASARFQVDSGIARVTIRLQYLL